MILICPAEKHSGITKGALQEQQLLLEEAHFFTFD